MNTTYVLVIDISASSILLIAAKYLNILLQFTTLAVGRRTLDMYMNVTVDKY